MTEPVSLAEAKQHLRVDDVGDDDLITGLIVTAREWVEGHTGHILTRRQVSEAIDSFRPWIDLRSWPIASVDSISYLDTGFASQPLDPSFWEAGLAVRPVRIVSRGYCWPALAAARGAITVTITAGYETPAQVPSQFKGAMKLIISGLYANRESGMSEEVELAAARLCRSGRRRRL